jgi:hypothetical protein
MEANLPATAVYGRLLGGENRSKAIQQHCGNKRPDSRFAKVDK